MIGPKGSPGLRGRTGRSGPPGPKGSLGNPGPSGSSAFGFYLTVHSQTSDVGLLLFISLSTFHVAHGELQGEEVVCGCVDV